MTPRSVQRPDVSPAPESVRAASLALVADEGLVAGIRAGDRRAFEAMFTGRVAALCSYAYRFVRSRELAEEIVQDVFCSIWARHGDWEIRSSIDAYLYGAVRHRALRMLAHEHVERRWFAGAALEATIARREGDDHGPADGAVLAAEFDAAVVRAVDALPRRAREVFTLLRREHLSYAQVAARLGISPRTVEIHMGRALKALRARLADLLP